MVTAAGESALLVPILLPAYVFEDKFTLKELAAFCKNCVDKDRIVIIEMYPVDEDRPPELHGPNRNRFYDEKARVLLRPGTVRYETAMMRIVEDIRDRFKELVEKYRKVILLAKTRANLDSYSRALREDLIASGLAILPEMKYPDDPTAFHENLRLTWRRRIYLFSYSANLMRKRGPLLSSNLRKPVMLSEFPYSNGRTRPLIRRGYPIAGTSVNSSGSMSSH